MAHDEASTRVPRSPSRMGVARASSPDEPQGERTPTAPEAPAYTCPSCGASFAVWQASATCRYPFCGSEL